MQKQNRKRLDYQRRSQKPKEWRISFDSLLTCSSFAYIYVLFFLLLKRSLLFTHATSKPSCLLTLVLTLVNITTSWWGLRDLVRTRGLHFLDLVLILQMVRLPLGLNKATFTNKCQTLELMFDYKRRSSGPLSEDVSAHRCSPSNFTTPLQPYFYSNARTPVRLLSFGAWAKSCQEQTVSSPHF